MDFKKILKAANKNLAKAKKRVAEDEPAFTEIPDGRYTARLTSAKLSESNAGRAQIVFEWTIEDGEYEGKVARNFQGIETEDNLFYLGRDLDRMGYEMPDDLTDLPELLKALEKEKLVAAIMLKTKPNSDFQNLYIRKVYTASDEDEDAEEETDDEVEETDDAAEESDEETEEADEEAEEEAEEESDEESAEEESDEEEEADEEEEEESEDDDEETMELDVDMRVIVETAKGREAGTVIEILEKEEKARVKLDNGKTVKVGFDRLEAEPVAAKKPTAKKPAPAPAKKTPTPAPAKKTGKKTAPVAKKKTRR